MGKKGEKGKSLKNDTAVSEEMKEEGGKVGKKKRKGEKGRKGEERGKGEGRSGLTGKREN